MTYPNTIEAFQAALLAYEPPEDQEAAIFDAQGKRSAVLQCVDVFGALKDTADLSADGLRLLLGAAHLIAAGGWHGLAGDAVTIIAARSRDLEPSPPPAPPA